MNCKKGDVAILVARHEKAAFLDGPIVKCERRIYRHFQHLIPHTTAVWWLCEGNFRDMPSMTRSPLESATRMELPDSWLKPLRDSDGQDETLEWKSLPSPHKEMAE
jgi:hypothetical protein